VQTSTRSISGLGVLAFTLVAVAHRLGQTVIVRTGQAMLWASYHKTIDNVALQ